LQIFGIMPLYGAPVEVASSEFHSEKTRMMRPSGNEKISMASLAVSKQYTNVTDRQTDKRTDTARQQRSRYAYRRAVKTKRRL